MISKRMVYDQHMSFLVNINDFNIRIQFTDSLCYILVTLGLIGNILGLCIFCSSRRTWRISSVYVYLATSSSIINIFCVFRYAFILHSKSRIILRELVGYVWLACKIYEFSFAFRIISSWITLFWMFERLTCVSKKLRSVFYQWNKSRFKFILPSMIIILILICVVGPPVYAYQPNIYENKSINSTRDTLHDYCGPDIKSSIKWQKYFNDIHLGRNHYTIRCLFSELIPAGTIILFNSYILYHLTQTSRRFSQTNVDEISKERKYTTSWMNLVLILHSFLFLFSLLSHIVGHFMSVEAHETWWVLLAILGNCSLNFYVYCLSGKAFRQQIIHFIQRLTTHNIYKLHIHKHQYKRNQHNSKKISLIDKCDQPKTSHLKTYRRSILRNSSLPIIKEESLM